MKKTPPNKYYKNKHNFDERKEISISSKLKKLK